jgi:ADP-heptose:LPS heptosyltransferase
LNTSPRILIVRPDRIGDVVLSTPLPREIKRNFPGSFVAVLLRKYTEAVYLNNPNVDEIILYDEVRGPLSLAGVLRKYKLDYSLTLLPTEKLNWILFLSGIRVRIGVGNKFYQFITNTKSVYRNKYIPLRHESEYCLDELRKLGIETESSDSEIHLSKEEQIIAVKRKKFLCPKGEILIGVNSSSGNSSPNMPAAEYLKLVKQLSNVANLRIAITDVTIPEELRNLKDVAYPNEGNSLRESIINFSILDLLISSSTGPMHIAAGLGVPALSIFCPLPACSPELWSPKGNKSEIILPDKDYCQNQCPGDPKKCFFQGEGGIDSELVCKQVMQLLNLK